MEDGAIDDSDSDDGELADEEDCEEGEILEPGSKPFVKPHCRFFMRGHCTWGINCRFLHPGINDKGILIHHNLVIARLLGSKT